MKVKELIEKLKKINQDLPIFVEGYEAGFDFLSIKHAKLKDLGEEEKKESSYNGRFCIADDGEVGSFEAIVIERDG